MPIPEVNLSRDEALVLPQSAAMTQQAGAVDSASSTTPIAVPDYTLPSESAERVAAAPSIASAKTRSKTTAVRLAKQRMSDDDEGE
jgi:hypothetical protein